MLLMTPTGAMAQQVPVDKGPIARAFTPVVVQRPASAANRFMVPQDLTQAPPNWATQPVFAAPATARVSRYVAHKAMADDVTIVADTVATTDDYAHGVAATSNGATTISVNGATTAGRRADGVHVDGYGPITIQAGTIATAGYRANGIYANNNVGGLSGGISIEAGSVTTSGEAANAVQAMGYHGTTSVNVGSIQTSGYGSHGVYASSYEGDAAVNVGSVQTTGDAAHAIIAYSAGTTTVIAGTVATYGQSLTSDSNAGGIKAVGRAVNVQAGTVATYGVGAVGIYANSNLVHPANQAARDITVTAGDVRTSGDYAYGIIGVNGMANGPRVKPGEAGNIVIQAGNISTAGFLSDGVAAINFEEGGNVTVHAGGVSTLGDYADGIYAHSTLGNTLVTVDKVGTKGAVADGIHATSKGGTTTVIAGSVTTSGPAAGGIDASTYVYQDPEKGPDQIQSGSVSVVADSVITSGVYSNAIFASGNGLEVTLTNRVLTRGDFSAGMMVLNDGAKAVSIHNEGDIATAGQWSDGINTFNSGTLTIDGHGTVQTLGDNALGITALSRTNVSVSQNSVTTSGAGSTAIRATLSPFGGTGFPDVHDVTVAVNNVTTKGDYALGILAQNGSNDGSVNVAVRDSLSTSGQNAVGIGAIAGIGGKATINVGSVTTKGSQSVAIAAYAGSVDIRSTGMIATGGAHANGINAVSSTGTAAIHVGTVATQGEGAFGISVSAAGASDIVADTVVTRGAGAVGIFASNYTSQYGSSGDAGSSASISIHTGAVSTTGYGADAIHAIDSAPGSISIQGQVAATQGDLANAVFAAAADGPVVVDMAHVSTAGRGSGGVYAIAANGDASVRADTVSTAGNGANGIYAFSGGGTANVTVGDVKTTGYYGSNGITAVSGAGDVSVTAGHVATTGFGSYGIAAQALNHVGVSAGSVDVAGPFSSGIIAVAGSADITVDGAIGTHQYASNGVFAITYGGDLTIATKGTITSEGMRNTGISAQSRGGNIAITSNEIHMTPASAGFGVGIKARAIGGDITINAGTVTTTGDNSTGIYAVSYAKDDTDHRAGTIAVTAGAVSTTGNGRTASGIAAFNHMQGGTTAVAVTGALTTQGTYAEGVYAFSESGKALVTIASASTAGADAAAVDARGTSVVIKATGAVQTTGEQSSGLRGQASAGGVTIDNLGTITVAGGGANGITALGTDLIAITSNAVRATGSGGAGIYAAGNGGISIAAINTSSTGSSAIVAKAGGTASISVSGQTSAGADGIVADGAAVTIDIAKAGAVIAGGDAIVAGIPATDGSRSAGGISVVNAGLISARGQAIHITNGSTNITNTGMIAGSITLADGNDSLTNGGVFAMSKDSNFGGGTDLFVNTGIVSVLAGASRAATVALLGLDRFENRGGLIDLRNGHVGDQLVLPGDYVGSAGARLGLDVRLSGDGAADTLVVKGAATGKTSIVLTNTSQGPAKLLAKPVTLVQVGTGSASDAFTLATPENGFVAYTLAFSPGTDSFGLTTTTGSSVRRLTQVTQGAQAIWGQQASAWASHMASRRDEDDTSQRLWGQTYGKVDTHRTQASGYDLGYRQDYYGVQMGVDVAATPTGDTSHLVFGLTAAYLSSNLNLRSGAERLRYDTLGFGGYASFTAGTLFANLLGQYNHYAIAARDGVLKWSDDINGNGYGAEAEIGGRLGGARFFAEPTVGLSWQHTEIGTLHALDQAIAFGDGTAFSGRFGARIGGTTAIGAGTAVFYARAGYAHRFSGNGSATLQSGGTSASVSGPPLADYGQGAVGVTLLSAGRVSGFIEGNVDVGRAYTGGGGRVGLRFKL